MSNVTLYSYFRSSSSYRARIALNLKKVAYEQKTVNLVTGEQHSGDYKNSNPQGLVPTLIDGDFKLTQSMAILDYLDEKHTTLNPFYPKDLKERAFVRQISNIISNDIHPIDNLRVLKYIVGELGASDEQKLKWYRDWVIKGFEAIEKLLDESPYYTGEYTCGANITAADICLIPQVYNAHRFDCGMENFPNIAQIEQRCLKHSAFDQARPEKQPDTPEELRIK